MKFESKFTRKSVNSDFEIRRFMTESADFIEIHRFLSKSVDFINQKYISSRPIITYGLSDERCQNGIT